MDARESVESFSYILFIRNPQRKKNSVQSSFQTATGLLDSLYMLTDLSDIVQKYILHICYY